MNCIRFENYHGLLCAIGYITAGCLKESYVSLCFFHDTIFFAVCLCHFFATCALHESLVHSLFT